MGEQVTNKHKIKAIAILTVAMLVATVITLFFFVDSNDVGRTSLMEYPPFLTFNENDTLDIFAFPQFIESAPIDQELPFSITPDNPGVNVQPYAQWVVYNKTGLQIFELEPVEYNTENMFTISFPPEPPYIVYGWITTGGSMNIKFPMNIKYSNLYFHYYNVSVVRRTVEIDSLGTEAEVNFELNDTTLLVRHTLGHGRDSGNPYGNLTVWEPTGRNTFYAHNQPAGEDRFWYGDTGARGEWRIRVELDEPSVGTTQWWIDSGLEFLTPQVEELGFEFY